MYTDIKVDAMPASTLPKKQTVNKGSGKPIFFRSAQAQFCSFSETIHRM
jgi:hypothetical protein